MIGPCEKEHEHGREHGSGPGAGGGVAADPWGAGAERAERPRVLPGREVQGGRVLLRAAGDAAASRRARATPRGGGAAGVDGTGLLPQAFPGGHDRSCNAAPWGAASQETSLFCTPRHLRPRRWVGRGMEVSGRCVVRCRADRAPRTGHRARCTTVSAGPHRPRVGGKRLSTTHSLPRSPSSSPHRPRVGGSNGCRLRQGRATPPARGGPEGFAVARKPAYHRRGVGGEQEEDGEGKGPPL